MPATVSSAPTAAQSNGKNPSTSKTQSTKKTRVVRRRGRGPRDMGSDDEIEREAASDTDSDTHSSIDSDEDEDEDEEDGDGDIGADRRAHSPSTVQNPSLPAHNELKPPGQDAAAAGPFARTGTVDWSEMVDEDDGANGELPIIDFQELGSHSVGGQQPPQPTVRERKKQTSRKSKVQPAPAASVPAEPVSADPSSSTVPPDDEAAEDHADTSRQDQPQGPSSSTAPRGPSGFSARQAYQERLSKDPAFIPRIGEFWGHDDRLFDKQLRPLSGFWRRSGRGGFVPRGRGRGGFMGPYSGPHGAPDASAEGGDEDALEPPEVPAVDRQWTHDGFEEMKRRDEQRRQQQQRKVQQPASAAPPGRGGARGGRGGFVPGPRGRGRGGSAAHYAPRSQPENAAPTDAPTETSVLSKSTTAPQPRIWYAQKPERSWTKQNEFFLYMEPNMKPRPGVGPGFKVRLPNGDGYVVRAPLRPVRSVASHKTIKAVEAGLTTGSTGGQDKPAFVVRLPPKSKEKAAPPQSAPIEQQPIAEPSVAAEGAAQHPESVSQPPSIASEPPIPAAITQAVFGVTTPEPRVFLPGKIFAPEGGLQMDLGPNGPPPASAVLTSSSTPEVSDSTRPPLPPIAIPNFNQAPQPAQPPQSSPQYGSPYGYPVALPPGIALDQRGIPFELATGRHVYLPTPPPPPQLYAPHAHAPHPNAMPFVPGHMHHHSSMSSISASPAPALQGFVDPATGRPIFTPPRQSSRIEIRAPTDAADGKSGNKGTAPSQPSALRTAVSAAEAVPDSTQMQQPGSEHMMMYPQYQQPYWYPEQQYGYQPYMDMSQMQGYEMYSQPPPEHMQHMQPPQSVYY